MMHSERITKAKAPSREKTPPARAALEPRTASILNAAERVFGTHGYAGASMRTIADEAGVAQALLHYHYSTKDNLYAAVFERRSSAITTYRGSRLDALFAREETATIEDVLSILFTPLSDIFHGEDAENLALYVQMVASISLGPDERSVRLREAYYDPIAERVIDALHIVIPGISRQDAVWAYLFAIGARQQAHAMNGRAARLGAPSRASSASRHYSQLVCFAAAGIRALVENSASSTSIGKARKPVEPDA
ncbi:TetR/AcrR family transcriptional regulator [Pseudomonas sp. UBA1879]|uniref:TetR/AcrR family transcriptional regulator n=1 Tax=Pseudomonas sp. UBA1879 TaxID=1947305 RepID=UPI0025D05C1C|nr:TetR/AcrR family transcriptional regulator [Pseudomonas sp. UBA1879]